MGDTVNAPFPAFGGKRTIAALVWERFGAPKQYVEPFCFSAAVLLAAPAPASLEVIGDANGFVANFWRCVRYQPQEVAHFADYPVSHIDLGARHRWLMEQRDRLAGELQDPDWPGDAKVAGWWLWGQCCWIGSGWCDWVGKAKTGAGQVPHVSNAGMGVQAIGKVPHVSDAGRGWLTSSGAAAGILLGDLARRLERVRVVHGHWDRCLNNHYGGDSTAVFLDPPYVGYEKLYGVSTPVAREAESWARDNAGLRIALCGNVGDYDLPGWEIVPWNRGRLTYAGAKTTDAECIWFSPACLRALLPKQTSLFGGPNA